MTQLLRLIPILVLSMLCLNVQAQHQVIDKVVGVVGNKIVLKSDVETQVQRYAGNDKVGPEIRCEVLNELLKQKILLTQAEIDSIVVGEDEIESELSRRLEYFIQLFNGSVDQLEDYYKKTIPEIKEDFRKEIKEQLLAQRMQSRVSSDIKITPKDVKKFFAQIPPDSLPYYDAEVAIRQLIVYPMANKASEKKTRDELVALRKRIVEGSDFGLMAKIYSQDPGSKKSNGELPEFGRNDGYVREFVGAAFKLEENQISDVFKTEFGYHIIQLMKRKGQRVKVRHILMIPEITTKDHVKCLNRLDSIKTEIIADRLSLSKAIGLFSEDEISVKASGYVQNPQTGSKSIDLKALGQIDAQLPFLIDTMRPGQFSEALPYTGPRGKGGYRLIYLESEIAAHVASLDQDYAKISNQALSIKKQQAFSHWMEKKVSKTYIKIDPSYSDCKSLSAWYKTID